MPGKERLDKLLMARRLAATPAEAAALIMAGKVKVAGRPETKAGARVFEDAAISVTPARRFASRGGEKLAHALREFGVSVGGKVCIDVGAAAGGFTSCLLESGAAHVHALDVGRGLLAWELRTDGRVTAWEGVNARHFDGGVLKPPPTLLTADVSFINVEKVLAPLVKTAPALEELIVLVKPQFEAVPGRVAAGGVVRDAGVHREVLATVAAALVSLGYPAIAVTASPLLGPAGNREFFLYGRRDGKPAGIDDAIRKIAEQR